MEIKRNTKDRGFGYRKAYSYEYEVSLHKEQTILYLHRNNKKQIL